MTATQDDVVVPSSTGSESDLASTDGDARFRALFNTSPDAYLIVIDGRILECNKAALELLKCSREEVIGLSPDVLAPERQPDGSLSAGQAQQRIAEVAANGSTRFEFVHRRPDGSTFWADVACAFIPYGGRPAVFASWRDITERKASDERLKLVRSSLDQSSEAVFWIRSDGSFFDVSLGACRALGHDYDSLKEKSVFDVDPEFPPSMWPEHWRQTQESGGGVVMTRHRRSNGEVFPVEVRTSLVAFGGEALICAIARNVSERTEAEKALRASEERFRRLAENAPDMIYRMAVPSGEYEYVSPAAERIFGYTPEEFYKSPTLIKNAIHHEFIDYFMMEWDKLVRGQAPESYDYKIIAKNGAIKWLHQRNVMVFDGNGNTIAIEGIVNDITAEKERDAALRRSREDLARVMDSMDALAYVADMDTHELLFLNKFGREAFPGFAPGKKCFEVLQKDQKEPCAFCTNKRLVDDSGSPTGVYRWEFQNTVTGAWFQCRDQAITWNDGRTVRLEIATEISELKAAQEELKQHRDYLDKLVEQRTSEIERISAYNRGLIEASIDFLVTISVDGKITDTNTATEELTGISRDKLIGSDFASYFTDPERARQGYKYVLDNGYVRNYELELAKSGGQKIPVEYNATVFRDNTGCVAGVFASARDISERKSSEAIQSKLTAELNTIIDGIPGLVFYKDAENRYLRVNEFVARAHGMSKDEMAGKSCFELYPEAEAKAYLEDDLKVIRSGRPRINIEEPWETESGRKWVSTSKVPSVDANGDVVGIIGISLDVTERRNAEELIRKQTWLKTGQAQLLEAIRGDGRPEDIASAALSALAQYIHIPMAAFYLRDTAGCLSLAAGFSDSRTGSPSPVSFQVGQGPVGTAAAQRRTIHLSDIPADSIRCSSGLMDIVPRELLFVPVTLGSDVRAVLELGTLETFTTEQREFLDSIAESLAVAINSAQLRERQRGLLEESQRMTEELQAQQEELRTANEELEEQAQRLKESEERLRAQQEELEVTNEELKEKNQLLEKQKREVEAARRQIQEKAEEVALASKYKSEFLANMSHELRTPLNSLLLLAQSLSENKEGNLTSDQVESAQVIHASGSALLTLINEVLDLARIEAGRMEIKAARVLTSDLADSVARGFRHMASEKGLSLTVSVEPGAPQELMSDRNRIEQIIRNLVGNAIKFTEHGGVDVVFAMARSDVDLYRSGLIHSSTLAISITDTGIGIPPQLQRVVFEAFQQVDGGTSRRYGGTGLGLSISRELAQLLGGEIQLVSQEGKGSTFTLYVPVTHPGTPRRTEVSSKPPAPAPGVAVRPAVVDARASQPSDLSAPSSAIPDDRDQISPRDSVILIIEDDPRFARILVDTCHEQGLKCLTASSGDTGLALARKYLPSGVLLDLHLPVMDGLTVLSELKDDTRTRHIPVHVLSVEESAIESLKKGAVGHATKPLNKERLQKALARLQQTSEGGSRRVLLIEDDPAMRNNVRQLVGGTDVILDEAATGQKAIEALQCGSYACIILDLGLPDMDGTELIRKLDEQNIELPPIIVHTARDFTEKEEMLLRENTHSIVIKDVRSQERLLDEVSLFLHRMVSKMPDRKKQMILDLHETDALLKNKQILLVDDDMRTSFALARLLSERGMQAIKAANGLQALQILEGDARIDLVLMDIMMPVMDGYEAMRRIRKMERFRRLPIIALTAKAMPEDRHKCIDAGANDYLAKPLDPERLISLMRVWLYR